MDANFWHQRWETNTIGFHQKQPNALLVAHFNALSIAPGSRVFVPLCGKTLDMRWLLSNGCRVAGAELSELAIQQCFAELGLEPEITGIGHVKRYSIANIDIFVGDIFDVSREMLGSIDAIFDRAALVALPEDVRIRYTKHLIDITDNAPQLLITYEYDQTLMDGPPFSISTEEVNRHYEASYEIATLTSVEEREGMKGKYTAKETIWHLKPLAASLE